VEIVIEAGVKLGCVPRRAAGEVARRRDAGEEVVAEIADFRPVPGPGERFAIPRE
jgi:hypothetical protein